MRHLKRSSSKHETENSEEEVQYYLIHVTSGILSPSSACVKVCYSSLRYFNNFVSQSNLNRINASILSFPTSTGTKSFFKAAIFS